MQWTRGDKVWFENHDFRNKPAVIVNVQRKTIRVRWVHRTKDNVLQVRFSNAKPSQIKPRDNNHEVDRAKQ